MGSKRIHITGTLSISAPGDADPSLEAMMRLAAEFRAVPEAASLSLTFPGQPEAQLRWAEYVAQAGVRVGIQFDPLLPELSELDRQVIANFTSVHGDDVYLAVRDVEPQQLVRVIVDQNVQQTAVALRKLSFIRYGYREQLWHDEWGLNLTRLHELLTQADTTRFRAAIYRIGDMRELRVQYLRDFVVACKQRGVI